MVSLCQELQLGYVPGRNDLDIQLVLEYYLEHITKHRCGMLKCGKSSNYLVLIYLP